MAVNLQTTENSTVYSSTQHSCELRPRRSGQRAAAYRVEGMEAMDAAPRSTATGRRSSGSSSSSRWRARSTRAVAAHCAGPWRAYSRARRVGGLGCRWRWWFGNCSGRGEGCLYLGVGGGGEMGRCSAA